MATTSTRALLGCLFLCIVACSCEARRGGRASSRVRYSGGSVGGSAGGYSSSSSSSVGVEIAVGVSLGILALVAVVVVLVFVCKYKCKKESSGESPSSGRTVLQASSTYRLHAAAPEHNSSLADNNGFSEAEPPSYDSVVNQKDGLPSSAEPNGDAQPYPAGDDVTSYPAQPYPSDPSAPLYMTEPSAPPPAPMGGAQYGVAPQGGPGDIGFAGNVSAM